MRKQYQSSQKNQLYTIGELASILKLSVSTIYKKVSRKEIPYKKAGRNVRFDSNEINDWLNINIREGKNNGQ